MPLLTYFWNLCLLRQGPERAPVSNSFMALLVPFYCITSLLLLSISDREVGWVLLAQVVMIGLAVQAACTWLLVSFKRRSGRYRATLAALLGANTLIMLCFVGIAWMAGTLEVLAGLIEPVYWICFFWWITVSGFILRRALDTSMLQGICLAFTMEMLSVLASNWVLPPLGPS